MEESEALTILSKLREGELEQYTVGKEDFLPFRAVLVNQEDRNQFVGRAHKGGTVTYTYDR
ncbi:hypothetical protein [Bacillus alkalicellulosilyticus]|uniref:hypothetical protein n=1 Tax=Alkalihalobacterium alkalicellulosilyticum TaxID=1912214 RepID=UPI0009987367|nr:hypothetical protein [Bacillus alkalicellulosilyticus]